MKEIRISVTEAARKFAACVKRVHAEGVTIVLLRHGSPVARIVPDRGGIATGRKLAEVLRKVDLSKEQAMAWYKDLQASRKSLSPARDKWHSDSPGSLAP